MERSELDGGRRVDCNETLERPIRNGLSVAVNLKTTTLSFLLNARTTVARRDCCQGHGPR